MDSPLLDCLAKADAALKGVDPCPHAAMRMVDRLERDPVMRETIETDLRQKHIPLESLTYIGYGRSGLCLGARAQGGQELAIMLREYMPIRRAPLPQQLQALCHFSLGERRTMEIMPALDTQHVTEAQMQQVESAIAQQPDARGSYYKPTDSALRQVGLAGELPLYIDADGLNKDSGHGGQVLPVPNPWVESDGTWAQYNVFKDLHAEFNSPLHQMGGQGVPLPEVTQRIDGSQTAPLRFGGGGGGSSGWKR